MTVDKLAKVVTFYREMCELSFAMARFGDLGRDREAEKREREPASTSHLAWMCDQILHDLIPTGRHMKAMRWLGFIQGVWAAREVFTLEQLRSHSRSEGEEAA